MHGKVINPYQGNYQGNDQTMRSENTDELWVKSESISGSAVGGNTVSEIRLGDVGFQATMLNTAVELVRDYELRGGYNITLAFSSNAVTCGVREYLAQFIRDYPVSMIVCTSGGVEEDCIKTKFDFFLESTIEHDENLRARGLNRSYNIMCPNDGYIWLADLYRSFIETVTGDPTTKYSDFCKYAGRRMTSGILFQANKKNIPVVVPAPLDGTLGDLIFSDGLKNNSKKILFEVSTDHTQSCRQVFKESTSKKLVIVLGGSIPKHHACNIHIAAGGADSVVLFNSELEYDGGNAGASSSELSSWGKAKSVSNSLKVWGDFSINFSLFCKLLKQSIKE